MDTNIFFNAKRKWFLAVGQLIFVALGACLLLYSNKLASVIVRNETLIQVVGAISLIYFGLIFLLSLKVYLGKIALVITDEELIDNSNSLSAGAISWSQVLDICQIQEGSVTMIKIGLIDANYIIEKENNF